MAKQNNPGCGCCRCASGDDESCCQGNIPTELKLIVPSGFTDGPQCNACDAIVGTFVIPQASSSFCTPSNQSTCWEKVNVNWCGSRTLRFQVSIDCVDVAGSLECAIAARIAIDGNFAQYKQNLTKTVDCDSFVWNLALDVESLTTSLCATVASSITIESN